MAGIQHVAGVWRYCLSLHAGGGRCDHTEVCTILFIPPFVDRCAGTSSTCTCTIRTISHRDHARFLPLDPLLSTTVAVLQTSLLHRTNDLPHGCCKVILTVNSKSFYGAVPLKLAVRLRRGASALLEASMRGKRGETTRRNAAGCTVRGDCTGPSCTA